MMNTIGMYQNLEMMEDAREEDGDEDHGDDY